jgi:peptidyl-prolyl cis-trans isomerase A (cyclophilin A)
MKFRTNGILATVFVLAVGTALQAQGGAPAQKAAPAAKPPATAAAGPFDKALLTPSVLTAKAPDTFDVKFTTSAGEFTVHVTRAWAPLGADRFYNLVKHHFFDGAAFFRVLQTPRPFMAQFGLSPYPEVNRAWSRATIKDDRVTQTNKRGAITFATAGANTRTTQLFINFGDNGGLDSQGFAPFGEVTTGMEVVDKLYSGYGEGAPQGTGPDQDKVTNQGRTYLQKNFPKLDTIKTTALIVPPVAPKPKP